ncbi:MAG: MFS transporter [Rhodococcus sp.]|nr:MFS transporter [Rhodococcus sp. (in: high G+C Gram-positive bacteria)]
MNSFQWLAIGICVLLNGLDGFDVLVMAFTANSVSAEWGLTGSQLGLLLSAGLFGMTAGALLLAPWADRIGRRKLIIMCVVVTGAGMILSSLSQNEIQLGILRFVTGLGIGGLLSSTNVLASEYSSARWRGLAVSLQSTGFAAGATLGGISAALLIDAWGWRSVFLVGGALSLIILPLVLWRLPESVDFIVTKGGPNALERANTTLVRMGRAPLAALPDTAGTHGGNKIRFTKLLSPEFRRATLMLWLTFGVLLFSYHFVTNWTPKLMISAGMSESEGISGGILLNLGGIVGTLIFGFLAARFDIRKLLATMTLITSILLAVFVTTTSSLPLVLIVGLLIGVFLNSAMAGLYSSAPRTYPADVRVTGVGTAIGIGRAGAIVSPMAVGSLIDSGWSSTQLYLAVALFMLVAVGAALSLRFDSSSALPARTAKVASPSNAH